MIRTKTGNGRNNKRVTPSHSWFLPRMAELNFAVAAAEKIGHPVAAVFLRDHARTAKVQPLGMMLG